MSNYLVVTLLVSTIALATVNAALPSYIHLCKRNEPDVSTCIKNSILALKEKLASGIPELEVPPLDPMMLDKLDLSLGDGFKAAAHNLKVVGGKNFEIKELKADIINDFFEFEIFIPELKAEGEYEIDATIAGIPLKGNGPLTLTMKSLTGKSKLSGKKVPRGGKTLYYFTKMELQADLKDYDIQLANLFAGDPTIGQATNKLLNDEKTEVLKSLLPALEKALVSRVILAGNNICKHFTWEELFPES